MGLQLNLKTYLGVFILSFLYAFRFRFDYHSTPLDKYLGRFALLFDGL